VLKNFWFHKWLGSIQVEIILNYPERFLNDLIRKEIVLWDVERKDEDVIRFSMFLKDKPILEELSQEYAIEPIILETWGLPVWGKRLKRNIGLLIGGVLGLFILFLLSNMIWQVEIAGASPELEYKLEKQLRVLGVRVGGMQFFVDPPEILQEKITRKNDEITWIGVEIHGTSYRFQVVEKERPEEEDPLSPRHLVAKKEAIIVDYFVEKGKPLISINDFVKPGQILVSGEIGNEKESKIIPAKGVIYGKTWYKTETEVKMKSKQPILTGESQEKIGIKIGTLYIPIWGFSKITFKEKKVEEEESKLKLFSKEFPLSLVKHKIWEIESYERVYTEEEAKKMALEISKKDLLRELPKDSKIVGEKILHESTDSGTFKIAVLYDVIENITDELPIIQSN